MAATEAAEPPPTMTMSCFFAIKTVSSNDAATAAIDNFIMSHTYSTEACRAAAESGRGIRDYSDTLPELNSHAEWR
jgi:hypothetical protein